MDERFILIHGFGREETMKILKAVKAEAENPQGIAFSITTPTNLGWTVRDLIKDVREEHEYMQAHPQAAKKPPKE